ncbi:MAG TPA: hypothetical protein VFI29_10355 [Hanamia sp.]|nr:hypothetical protein [Hanamia sp.]
MNSTNLNYLSVLGAIICLILPVKDLITNPNNADKWYKRITGFGWIFLSASIYWGIISMIIIHVVGNEKIQDGKALRNDLSDSFNVAVQRLDTSWKYNILSNKIEGKGGGMPFIYMHDNKSTRLYGNSFQQTSIQEGKRDFISSFPNIRAGLVDSLRKIVSIHHLKDSSVYLVFMYNTNGYLYFNELQALLESNNYKVIAPVFNVKWNDESLNLGINFRKHEGKIAVVVGNLF